ncbi:MAG: hypothetical protein DWQ08_09280 [Proteobacteria bacterium]|nr:MAG: hypothetical protein DWQ08_09280 [Pseudomonadota bacterium]
MARRIVLVFHEKATRSGLPHYLIYHLAKVWAESGSEVRIVFGTKRFVPADLAILHIDLSVVDESYVEFVSRYPISLNAGVRDIRKTATSGILLSQHAEYEGPVIVKSNLNCGGDPERRYLAGHPAGGTRNRDFMRGYKILRSIEEVPPDVWADERLVVERFVPEREGDKFYVRHYMFLGDRFTCVRKGSSKPIITVATSSEDRQVIPVPPEMEEKRKSLGFDYGKFDYVEHDGRPCLLDANKTMGAVPSLMNIKAYKESLRNLALGLDHYFDS